MLIRRITKNLLKLAFYPFHFLCLDRLQWWLHRDPLRIFFAHRVLPKDANDPASSFFEALHPQALRSSEFERRIRWLVKRRHIVSLDHALAAIRSRDGIKGLAVLTFDDAYSDFVEIVHPMLEKFDIPATYYITAGAVGAQKLLWFDRYYSAVIGAQVDQVIIQSLGGIQLKFGSLQEKIQSAVTLGRQLWKIDLSQRDDVIEELVEKIGKGPLNPAKLYLSPEDLKRLAQSPRVTIGSHTMTHPNLLRLSDKEIIRELSESKELLEEITGSPVLHLSYPNGLGDERIADLARKCGYRSACATGSGTFDDLFMLPRTNIGHGSYYEFAVKVSGFWKILELLRNSKAIP